MLDVIEVVQQWFSYLRNFHYQLAWKLSQVDLFEGQNLARDKRIWESEIIDEFRKCGIILCNGGQYWSANVSLNTK